MIFDRMRAYITRLHQDIYPQPPDPGHQEAMEDIGKKWLAEIDPVVRESLLDIGCGQGQGLNVWQQYAAEVQGITMGSDVDVAQAAGYVVQQADMSFLPYDDESIDILMARHVLEHSPMPLLTLMEWHRVARHYLIVVVPDYRHYGNHGRNHYYVLTADQWEHLFDIAGWERVWASEAFLLKPPFEYRWLLRKKEE